MPLLRIVPVLAFALLPLLLQALCLMFIVGRKFDERFPYERIEALTRQSLAFPRLSMKLFFCSHRTVPCRMKAFCPKHGQNRSLQLVPSLPMPMIQG